MTEEDFFFFLGLKKSLQVRLLFSLQVTGSSGHHIASQLVTLDY